MSDSPQDNTDSFIVINNGDQSFHYKVDCIAKVRDFRTTLITT